MMLAEQFRNIRRLRAFIHFDRNDAANSSPELVIGTLCYQLARFQPDIGAAVSQRIRDNPKLPTFPISSQFNQLLLEPLLSIPSLESGGPMIIILDPLDECGDAESSRTLLQVLSSGFAKLPPVFRILVTSRKEFDITSALSSQPNIDPRPLAAAGNDDIEHFFHHSLADTTIRFDLAPGWLDVNVIPQLTRLSEGLWIWASTAVKFIESDSYPPRQLKHLLPTFSHTTARRDRQAVCHRSEAIC
jgi:hypothetical protein